MQRRNEMKSVIDSFIYLLSPFVVTDYNIHILSIFARSIEELELINKHLYPHLAKQKAT